MSSFSAALGLDAPVEVVNVREVEELAKQASRGTAVWAFVQQEQEQWCRAALQGLHERCGTRRTARAGALPWTRRH
jgi:hypothetical protein